MLCLLNTKVSSNDLFQVNVLMHTDEVALTPEQLANIEELKKRHHKQDQREFFGNGQTVDGECSNNLNDKFCKLSISSGNSLEEVEAAEGGALWDIFRRQDIPKLNEYLNKHFREFRHTHCCPLPQVSS